MHTDKPQSLSIKDYIIRRLSPQLRQSEDVISRVIAHQYVSASNATKNSREVEISGLGKFLFSDRKAKKREKKLEAIKVNIVKLMGDGDESKKDNYNLKIKSIDEELDYIKTKLDNELDK